MTDLMQARKPDPGGVEEEDRARGALMREMVAATRPTGVMTISHMPSDETNPGVWHVRVANGNDLASGMAATLEGAMEELRGALGKQRQ